MLESPWPNTIAAINDLPSAQKTAIYGELVPEWVQTRFGVDPQTLSTDGQSLCKLRCPAGARGMEITIWPALDAPDPLLYLNMADNDFNQLVVLLLVVNDPAGPRFDVDRPPDGAGVQARNLIEEERAMRYGLAPGQIRPGLRVFRSGVARFESFVDRMGHDVFFIEPLAYHNAITFERYGFAYTQGRKLMEQIHSEFQPGGTLHARLDGHSPFRDSGAWELVRGRSWAIHDGILGRPFDGFQMYKQIGKQAGIDTFPGSRW